MMQWVKAAIAGVIGVAIVYRVDALRKALFTFSTPPTSAS
jgi:hypothetical protein